MQQEAVIEQLRSFLQDDKAARDMVCELDAATKLISLDEAAIAGHEDCIIVGYLTYCSDNDTLAFRQKESKVLIDVLDPWESLRENLTVVCGAEALLSCLMNDGIPVLIKRWIWIGARNETNNHDNHGFLEASRIHIVLSSGMRREQVALRSKLLSIRSLFCASHRPPPKSSATVNVCGTIIQISPQVSKQLFILRLSCELVDVGESTVAIKRQYEEIDIVVSGSRVSALYPLLRIGLHVICHGLRRCRLFKHTPSPISMLCLSFSLRSRALIGFLFPTPANEDLFDDHADTIISSQCRSCTTRGLSSSKTHVPPPKQPSSIPESYIVQLCEASAILDDEEPSTILVDYRGTITKLLKHGIYELDHRLLLITIYYPFGSLCAPRSLRCGTQVTVWGAHRFYYESQWVCMCAHQLIPLSLLSVIVVV